MLITRTQLVPGGVEVSRIVYGVWRILDKPMSGDLNQLKIIFRQCIERGVSTFDHADVYGDYQCEELFGQILEPSMRHQIQLITKYGIKLVSARRPQHRIKSYDASSKHLLQSVEQSLRNLRTDYLDLLLLHRPDPLMDAEALGRTVDQLIQTGKIRGFGVSNFSSHQFDLLQSRCSHPLVTNQIEANPLKSQVFFDGTLDHAQRLGYKPMIWSPLAGGRIWSDQSPARIQLRKILARLSQDLRVPEEAIVLAWLLKHPAGLVPVLGSINPERLVQQLCAQDVNLSSEDWFEILQAGSGVEIP